MQYLSCQPVPMASNVAGKTTSIRGRVRHRTSMMLRKKREKKIRCGATQLQGSLICKICVRVFPPAQTCVLQFGHRANYLEKVKSVIHPFPSYRPSVCGRDTHSKHIFYSTFFLSIQFVRCVYWIAPSDAERVWKWASEPSEARPRPVWGQRFHILLFFLFYLCARIVYTLFFSCSTCCEFSQLWIDAKLKNVDAKLKQNTEHILILFS